MKSKLVRIGNSRGIRIPKPLIQQAGLEEEVELRVVDAGILIENAPRPRSGWGDAAATLAAADDAGLIDGPVATDFDETEWAW